MTQNLDSLKDEIQTYLESEGFLVFHGYPRPLESEHDIRWNSGIHSDFRPFLAVAHEAGIKLIVFVVSRFDTELIDETLVELEEADVPREEKRVFERRLRELRSYEGFTFEIELSFDYAGRTYFFQLQTEWFSEYQDLLDEIDATIPQDDEEENGPIGGYFSNN